MLFYNHQDKCFEIGGLYTFKVGSAEYDYMASAWWMGDHSRVYAALITLMQRLQAAARIQKEPPKLAALKKILDKLISLFYAKSCPMVYLAEYIYYIQKVDGAACVQKFLKTLPAGVKYILKRWDYGVEPWFKEMWDLPGIKEEFCTRNILCWRRAIDPLGRGICKCSLHSS